MLRKAAVSKRICDRRRAQNAEIQKNKDFVYEIPKIRVKIQVKAVVLGILLHAERKSNLRLIFW